MLILNVLIFSSPINSFCGAVEFVLCAFIILFVDVLMVGGSGETAKKKDGKTVLVRNEDEAVSNMKFRLVFALVGTVIATICKL